MIFAAEIDFVQILCDECGICFLVPSRWLHRKSADRTSFTCPNGHVLHYFEGPNHPENSKVSKPTK